MTTSPDNCICVVQARRGSSRLPDKVLMPLAGKPVLAHAIERCGMIPGVSRVIVAVPDSKHNDPLASLAASCGAHVVRGSEQDVLSRYVRAAQSFESDYVMRVTADCPLLDPQVCGDLLAQVMARKAHYGVTAWWPHGLDCEVMERGVLMEADRATDNPLDREHVTLWMKRNEALERFVYHADQNYAETHRWVLDYPEDKIFLERVFAHFADRDGIPGWQEIAAYVDSQEGLSAVNQESARHWRDRTADIYAKAASQG